MPVESLEAMSEALSRSSLSEQVYTYIKNAILDGSLEAGQRIPEDRIAGQLGVSRTPIREAIRRLGEYGLVTIKPRSYAEVAGLSPEEAEDVTLLRASLETLAVRQLARRVTAEDVDLLARIADRVDGELRDGRVGQAFVEDSRFHLEIARLSGNRHLYELADRLDAKVQMLRLVLQLPQQRLAQFVAQHRTIIDRLGAGDAEECERLMRNHVLDQLYYLEPSREERR